MKESKIIQGEIMLLLNKELSRPSEAAKHEVSKRCKDIANFMEYLMDEVNKSNLQLDLPQETEAAISVSLKRRVSVVFFFSKLGDYCVLVLTIINKSFQQLICLFLKRIL